MRRSTKHIFPMLCIIVILAGVLVLFQSNPAILQSLPWLAPDEPPAVEPLPPEDQTPEDDPPVDEPGGQEPPEDEPPEEDPPEDDPPAKPTTVVALTGSFYTYEEMKEDMAQLCAYYPDILSYRAYGTSADGRELLCATLGNPAAGKQVIITAGMHAREYVNSYAVMLQIEYYLQNYDTATYKGYPLRTLLDEVCFVIAPMTNPDGITLAQEGIGAIRSEALRKTIRDICRTLGLKSDAAIDEYLNKSWKSNARGVDVNRNFDALWAEHADGVGMPWVKNYKGAAALSEPEAAGLVALTESLSDPVASVCIHSQGEIIYWRCFQVGISEVRNRRLAELASRITGYAIIDENQTEPSFSNWTILARDIPTITVETGLGGYPQDPATMTAAILDDIRDLWAALALEYGDFGKG